MNYVFHSKLNIKVLSEPVHKPRMKVRSDFLKLKEERSSRISKVYKKFQKKILHYPPIFLYIPNITQF
jgi:hypothetical protein